MLRSLTLTLRLCNNVNYLYYFIFKYLESFFEYFLSYSNVFSLLYCFTLSKVYKKFLNLDFMNFL